MLVAILDSATSAVTAAVADVADDVRALAVRSTVDARAHGELLAPQLADALREAGARPADLAAIVAGLGPGPFTGLRVGLVTAAALGDSLGVPTYGVCSLDGIGARTTGRVLVATDARRREVYWAVYEDGVRVGDPAVDLPAAVAPGGIEYAAGEGAHRYDFGVPVLDEPRYPDPFALAALAAERVRTKADGERLTPLYLRRPDAVEPKARKAVLT